MLVNKLNTCIKDAGICGYENSKVVSNKIVNDWKKLYIQGPSVSTLMTDMADRITEEVYNESKSTYIFKW